MLKGRQGSGNNGNFESGQNKSKVCSCKLKDRECNPLFVTMDTSCTLLFPKGTICCSYVPETAYWTSKVPCPSLKEKRVNVKSVLTRVSSRCDFSSLVSQGTVQRATYVDPL